MSTNRKHRIEDLQVAGEILPLFDRSLNSHARTRILEILSSPLDSLEHILERQEILRGFLANHAVLDGYSYTVLYLNEVHHFLNDFPIEDLSRRSIRYRLFAPKRVKRRIAGKLNQLILLFHRLDTYYLGRLRVDAFPPKYRKAILGIRDFFSEFNLGPYEIQIREERLRDADVIDLTRKIVELRAKGRVDIFWEDFFEFEAFVSLYTAIQEHGLAFPDMESNRMELRNLYHPALLRPVKNDFKMAEPVVVVNGPNMSGKSTFMRAVALCMYLGHLGLGVPATEAKLPFVDHFAIHINRKDDLKRGYSHFMNEIKNLKEVLLWATQGARCFVIFDELFSGTNIEDAREICNRTLRGLSQFDGSFFLISTHIQELRNLQTDGVSHRYIDCRLADGIPSFTYELKEGWSDIQIGRILFQQEGLNDLLGI